MFDLPVVWYFVSVCFPTFSIAQIRAVSAFSRPHPLSIASSSRPSPVWLQPSSQPTSHLPSSHRVPTKVQHQPNVAKPHLLSKTTAPLHPSIPQKLHHLPRIPFPLGNPSPSRPSLNVLSCRKPFGQSPSVFGSSIALIATLFWSLNQTLNYSLGEGFLGSVFQAA